MRLDFLKKIPYICDRWTALVARNPSAVLITEELSGKSFTRKEVDDLSARVYALLLQNSIGTEEFVLIKLPRDARPFIAMLGVWKAGAAFTVVEDTYAPERIEAIREDCGCRFVIDEAAWAKVLATEPQPGFKRADEHDACFAIYTSGSTGKPKGVLQEYGKIKLNQASMEAQPGDLIDETTCMAMLSPVNFIAAVKIWMNALYSGMHLVLFSMETARNPVRMKAQFLRYKISLAFISPSVLRVMSEGVPASLKTLVTGSESANGLYFGNVKLINNYGMSEAGFHVAQYVVDRRHDVTPIGKPVFSDIRIMLLDENDREVPDGEEGEICFDNPFFRGYVNLPKETAKALRGGIFHSGDMGKRLPDGNIVVTGRLNTMVKINGNRVEPGEIEACMRKIPGIKDAVVKDFKNERQQVFLCGYYTLDAQAAEDRRPGDRDFEEKPHEEHIPPDDREDFEEKPHEEHIPPDDREDFEEKIREELSRTLPHYMVPAFFMQLDKLPLNNNGKVDRFALPRPDVSAKTKAYAAPETQEEAAICKAFETVLGLDRVGVNDDFFELGGDSLSTALLAAELEELHVDYKDIYAWKTPRKIADRLSEKTEKDLDALSLAAQERDQYLTPYQTYFYDAMLYSPLQTGLNNPISLRFPKGAVEPERLRNALETVFNSYAVFSSVFSLDDEGVPVMRRIPGRIVHPEILEVSEHTDQMLEELIQPYRLDGELMYRCRICVTQEHTYLDLDTCHLISDGSTMANFMSELFAAYRGEPLRKDHYYYYLENHYRQRAQLEQEADAQLLMKRFSPDDYLCNPVPDLVSRHTANGQNMGFTNRSLGEYTKGCEKLRTSLNKLFVAAALAALSEQSGLPKVTVEWTFNGRDENWKKDLIGMTLSSIPVAVDMSKVHTPREILREIDEQNALGIRYADLSLGNNGVTPGERDRMIVVCESGFDMNAFFPEGTEATFGYDKLNGVFTRFQVIVYDSTDPNAPIPFYINYDSNLYSLSLVERFKALLCDALDRMITCDEL